MNESEAMTDKFHFPEGSGMEVFGAVAGQYNIIEHEKGRHYEVDEKELKGSSFLYSLNKGWELMVNQYYSEAGVILEEIPSSRDLIVLRFVDGGMAYVVQGHEGEIDTALTVRGITMVRMNRPLKASLYPKRWVRWVSLRLNRDNWEIILNHKNNALLEMIFNKRGWLLQESFNLKMEDSMSELFDLQQYEDLRVGMSFAKGFELLSHFAKSLMRRSEAEGEFGVLDMNLDVLLKIKQEWALNLPAPPTVDEMAEKYGVSKLDLSRNFKHAFGMSPEVFFDYERLRNAYRLVCRSLFSFGEIAFSLGYAHSGQFSSAFKKEFGISPSEARQQNRPLPDA